MIEPTPIYSQTAKETGLDGDQISDRCSALATFSFTKPSTTPPRPGQKPDRKRVKKP